jgi:hypothetical protein
MESASLREILCLAAGCTRTGLSLHEITTLNSLRQVDDWPLYVMHYRGAYPPLDGSSGADVDESLVGAAPAWACSLFAALGDPSSLLYGRNFDWRPIPAVLLFADPPDGYASVSMVDITYLGYEGERAQGLDERPFEERRSLLWAPYIPIDGINERGLVIAMAAVSMGDELVDPDKDPIGSLHVMRKVLDHAADVDEALEILDRYSIHFEGPPLHYLVADRSGRALLVEYYQGERLVHPNEQPWHLATNFVLASAETPQGHCWRYDILDERLTESQGRLTPEAAMESLVEVSNDNTQWSISYNLSTGQVQVAMGRGYDEVHTFKLGIRD